MVYVIITAAGLGSRFNSSIPKQFVKFNDKELLKYTIDQFDCIDCITHVGIPKGTTFKYKNVNTYTGGNCGQETIFKGLQAIMNSNKVNKNDVLIIQDGNRPCTKSSLIQELLSFIRKNPEEMVCPKIPIYGISSSDGTKQFNRNDFVYTQMPCCCNLFQLFELYSRIEDFDSYSNPMEVWCTHKHICFVEGDLLNIKITYPKDIEVFNMILGQDTSRKNF